MTSFNMGGISREAHPSHPWAARAGLYTLRKCSYFRHPSSPCLETRQGQGSSTQALFESRREEPTSARPGARPTASQSPGPTGSSAAHEMTGDPFSLLSSLPWKGETPGQGVGLVLRVKVHKRCEEMQNSQPLLLSILENSRRFSSRS